VYAFPHDASNVNVPVPLFVNPPVVGATAPPTGTPTTNSVPAPTVCTINSLPVVPVNEPVPPIVFDANANTPPESNDNVVNGSNVNAAPGIATFSVNELIPVNCSAPLAFDNVNADAGRMFQS
jgi:hypothetical protein